MKTNVSKYVERFRAMISGCKIFVLLAFSIFAMSTHALPANKDVVTVKTASQAYGAIQIDSTKLLRNGSFMTVDFSIAPAGFKVNRNRTLVVTPAMVNGKDTLKFRPVEIYGRTRLLQQERLGNVFKAGNGYFTKGSGNDNAIIISSNDKNGREVRYHDDADFSPWMENGELIILLHTEGCCDAFQDKAQIGPLAMYVSPKPAKFEIGVPHWIIPDITKIKRSAKNRELTGSAFIDFPVNQTVIYPDFGHNRVELAAIRRTLDVVFTDPDVTVKEIEIHGYASPEGPYANNVRLAKGRTGALKDYVRDIYKIPEAVFVTASTPEDWTGLRKAVESMVISNKSSILSIIDSDKEPDAKDWLLKSHYPAEYAILLKEVYPGLRRSDYRIGYLVRNYEEVTVIEKVMNDNASKLSPEEFYIAASAHAPGSPEYFAIYALALQYYPDDTVSNYNMAIAAMMQGDAESAEARLAKAPEGPEKEWAKGKLNELKTSK